MKNSKLRAVVRHEYLTIIKQPSFWISLIAIPLLMAIIILISVLTDSSNNRDVDKLKGQLTIAVIDKSDIISPDVAKAYNLHIKDSAEQTALENSVKSGGIDGLIMYPKDLEETGKYQMLADNTDGDNSAIVTELGRTVLQQSLLLPLGTKELATLALSGGDGSIQSYKDGKPDKKFIEYVVPGAFLVLFYIVLIFSVGYALTSVSEEKENRSIEMVLSYVKPQTLILGKLLGIILVTLTQIAIIALLGIAGYLIARAFGNDLSLPFNVSDLTFVPFELLIGIGFLIFGFIFYVALMAMIGAIFPSSKEAGSFSTVFFILPALPFWGIDAITGQAASMYTQILTYFPLTSPTTVLLRNMTGNLSVLEGIVSLVILVVATIITLLLAAKAFRLGTLEYSERIKFGSLFK